MGPKGSSKGKDPADEQPGGASDALSIPSGQSTPVERPGSRLGSIGPQKFTLGGVEKKTFRPKISLRRGKSSTDASPATTPAASEGEQPSVATVPTQRREGPPVGAGRGRGGPRGAPAQYVQQVGLFSGGATVEATNSTGVRGGAGGGNWLASGPPSAIGSVKKQGVSKPAEDEPQHDDDDAMAPVALTLGHGRRLAKARHKAVRAVKAEAQPEMGEDTMELDVHDGRSDEEAPVEEAVDLAAALGDMRLGQIHFMQLPAVLPVAPDPATLATKREAEIAEPDHLAVTDMQNTTGVRVGPRQLQGLGECRLGQLRVHRSGRVTLMLGDIPFEVRPGAQASFLQSAVLLDAEENKCEFIGDIDKRFVLAPDLQSLLR